MWLVGYLFRKYSNEENADRHRWDKEIRKKILWTGNKSYKKAEGKEKWLGWGFNFIKQNTEKCRAKLPLLFNMLSSQITDTWKLDKTHQLVGEGGVKRGTVGGLLRRNPSLYNWRLIDSQRKPQLILPLPSTIYTQVSLLTCSIISTHTHIKMSLYHLQR